MKPISRRNYRLSKLLKTFANSGSSADIIFDQVMAIEGIRLVDQCVDLVKQGEDSLPGTHLWSYFDQHFGHLPDHLVDETCWLIDTEGFQPWTLRIFIWWVERRKTLEQAGLRSLKLRLRARWS